jgi:hypothetical protein
MEKQGATKAPSLATALQQSQGRKRKGSLRKAAMAKMQEHSGSLRKEATTTLKPPIVTRTMRTTSAEDEDLTTDRSDYEDHSPPVLLASPSLSSPEGPYGSTTDEDEPLSLHHHTASTTGSSFPYMKQDLTKSVPRRRSHRPEPYPSLTTTTVQTPIDFDLEDDWDYSETEWWGWIILIVTWIVFVVVMGSCLGVWSWAWDVGETPYAPPELEDDDTLPITGYYPALIVCTAVMSWVWVVVAWVGMKYFRHSG